MSEASRVVRLNPEQVPADIVKLAAAVQDLPLEYRKKLGPVVEQVIESAKRRRRILRLVQDALSQLRLDMKYLLFDLEATRRERDAFRKELGDDAA